MRKRKISLVLPAVLRVAVRVQLNEGLVVFRIVM